MTVPAIGVLLPVRLETRFVKPDGQRGWRVRVRVVPDGVSITNHDEDPTTLELDAVETMWRAVGAQGLESRAGRRAWLALAAAVGAERAAWLARRFPPIAGPGGQVTIARPDRTRTEMRRPRVMGLPPTMQIWIARGGGAPALAATLSVRSDEIDLDLDRPDSTRQPWWTSFPEAVRVGLAAEIDLGTVRPMDIDAVYLVGIGGGDPGPLLTSQADSGSLGIVAPGSATSTVNGEASVPLGDADTWRRLVAVGPTSQAGTVAISTALAGAPIVPGVIGGDADHRPLNRAIVSALWPALWGHSLANVWGYASEADELGLWAADNLVPEGPLPSMRIRDHPYGLLPGTSLRRWRAAAGDPAIESKLVPLVRELVRSWAAAAEQQAAQRPADALHDLVRNPTATRYAWRWLLPTRLAHAMSFRFNQPVPASDLQSWWTRRAGETPRLDPAATPARQLIAVGWDHDVELRLAEPDDLPAGTSVGRGLARLAAASVAELLAAGPVEGRPRTAPPWGSSMLTELARHSLLASAAAVARRAAGQARAIVEPVSVDRQRATEGETWAARFRPTDMDQGNDPAIAIRRNVIDGLRALGGATVPDLERGLRAALDTATHRLDPWATAIAWRRLQALAAAARTTGVYGWVDAPRPRTSDGDPRFVLAPSTEQAAVAAVLRDRALRDPDADRWQMDLTSDAVRGALRLAAEAREGSHPVESLGRMVEAIVNRPDVIDRLRAAFPSIRSLVRADFRVRRVCDGVAVLDATEKRPGDLSQLGVRPAQLKALAQLAVAVDALADLHVAEATLGVIRGRGGTVSATTSAAAGQGLPSFDVVRTPRGGRVVNTIVVVVLPDAGPPSGPRPSPAAVADSAVAAYLDDRSGDPAGAAWTWTTLDAAGHPLGTITLAGIGLRPCDTVGLGTGNLRDVVRDVSGAAGVGPADPAGHARVRAFAAALAGLPAASEDLGAPPDPGGAATAELAARYTALRDAAAAAAAEARLAAAPTGTEAARRAALGQLARWGITPLGADVPDPTVGGLVDRVRRAAEVLERRIGDSPANAPGMTIAELGRAIGALVAPEGPWPVYARLPAATFRGLRLESTNAGEVPRLDPDWLEVLAPVRPALGRLEAVQLGQRITAGGRPLRAWSSKPDDPWQTQIDPSSDTAVARPSRLVAAFGPAGVLPSRPTATTPGTVAVAVIDRFAETVPSTEQVSAVAFPHDVPVARAPQAVVLAVPPVADEELTAEVLVDIVAEVRDLARARMADAAQMGPVIGSLHLAALPSSGRAGVELGTR